MDRYQPRPPAICEEDYQPLCYSFVGFEGFLNAKLLVEILRRMPPELDRRQIRSTVESIRGLDLGIEAPVSFGPDKHQGIDSVYYTVAENGQFVPVRDWKRWSK
jgi:hypothetical protein